MFVFIMFGWLGCNHLGLDVAFMEALAKTDTEASDQVTGPSSPRQSDVLR